jgi:23S rRNA pseudouridine1911/1915/1917 synthase
VTRTPAWLDAELPRPVGVPEGAMARMLRVPPELAGLRLDVFLSLSLRSTSRTRAKLIAKSCAFYPDGTRLRPNQRLKPEDRVVLWRVPSDQIDDSVLLPELYRDEHLLVVDKPPGLTVHPTASHFHGTVIKILERRFPEQPFFSLLHRLDKDTSGILLIGLTPQADRAFKMLLEGTLPIPDGVDATIQKSYRAITWGVPSEGMIDAPLEPDPHPMRVKMRVAAPGRGFEARTRVTVEARAPGYALVRCDLFTGRQHQIRVHLASLGTPVVGDRLYGPDDELHRRGADGVLDADDLRRLEMPRQALHAARYALPHALTWQSLAFDCPLPSDMSEFWHRVSGAQPG